MKIFVLAAAAMAGTLLLMACEQPVARVPVPGPNDQSAYRPVPMEKPLPPNGYVPGLPPEGMPGQSQGPGMQPGAAGMQPGIGAVPTIANEDIFVQTYVNHRSPQMMIFVNRTSTGDPIGNADDYQMIEASLVRYFDNSGKVQVKDSDAARQKLNREQILRLENGDPAANRLLATELQQDVLISVSAQHTDQASMGNAIRLIAKAVSTTDARNLGTAFVDMPLPMSKTNINIYTQYLASDLMGQMAQKWAQAPEFDPIEVRIYKAAAVDDSIKIEQWLQKTQGVTQVRMVNATGSSTTSYATLNVGFAGAPEDLYANLKDAIGQSQGLKAVDLQHNTINLEVTGPMNLVTTTRHSETTTTTETHTTEDQRVQPINPAPAAQQ